MVVFAKVTVTYKAAPEFIVSALYTTCPSGPPLFAPLCFSLLVLCEYQEDDRG
jgi:hypothetical protein